MTRHMPTDRAQSALVCMSLTLLLASVSLAAEPRDTQPGTWAATDALGRVLPMREEVGESKAIRTVGIFYFNWHAAFGNPKVHDIAKILAANPSTPPWGPVHTPHYWSEPRFGYDRPDDAWVIGKQILMLADAGVDVLILDATNAFTYHAEREALCTVLEQVQAEGQRVPQIAMFALLLFNGRCRRLTRSSLIGCERVIRANRGSVCP